MEYNFSEIMIKAWNYRGDGLSQSEAMKKAWKDIKTSKDALIQLKAELEEQLKAIQYQIDNLENPIPKIVTYTIEKGLRDNIKCWGAIITGLDKKFGFKREFKSYRYTNDVSSKHAYYDYYIDVGEGQFFETGLSGSYKKDRKYFQVKNGEIIAIKAEKVVEGFK